jgi:hypothetical protein
MTHATMPGLSLDATAKADDWVGPGITYRVEAQFGLHVTKAQLHADLRAAPGCLAAHHPAVVISDDGRASIQLDVTAVDIWLALLEAMVSVKGVFHEPLAVRVVRSVGSDTTEYGATRATPNSRRRGPRSTPNPTEKGGATSGTRQAKV